MRNFYCSRKRHFVGFDYAYMKNKDNVLALDEIHAALLELMAEFDKICTEHNLRYSLAYGTLLGAVRHKGFIPWDDDVDFVMPRPDYERLYALIHSGEIDLGDHLELSEDRGKKAFYSFLKLMDKRYTIKRWSQKEVKHLYVDIFPLDGAPEEEKKLKKLYRKRLKYSAIMALARWAVPEKKWMLIFRVLGFPFYLAATLYGMSHAANKANKLAAQNDFETHAQYSTLSFGTEKWLMPRETFDETVRLPFCDREFTSIAAWDEWLTKNYGDYMTPPPEGKRYAHSLKVFKTEQKD